MQAQSNGASAQSLSVILSHDRVVTTSANVARVFGKQHGHVLRDIDKLREDAGDWGVSNFGETPYVDAQNGQTYRAYEMTRDGFTLLAMGFTGERSLQFKIAYINEFNRMEAQIRSGQSYPPLPEIFGSGRWLADVNESGWPQLTRIPDDAVFAFPEDPAAMVKLVDALPIDIVPAVLNAAAMRLTGVAAPKLTAPRQRGKKPSVETPLQRLVRYVRNSKKYARDRKYTDVLRLGMMPYAKALKLMGLNASEFRQLVREGIEAKALVLSRMHETGYFGEVIQVA